LKEFIDENKKLLTAIGVMGALAALFTPLKNGEFVSFISFAMLIVLYAEFISSLFKVRGPNPNLVCFPICYNGVFQCYWHFPASRPYWNYVETYGFQLFQFL